MDRIPEQRMGVVWCKMTNEEQSCLRQAFATGKTILYITEKGNWCEVKNPTWSDNVAYFAEAWLTCGSAVVGYLCWLSDRRNHWPRVFGVVSDYIHQAKSPYQTYENTYYKYAKPVQKSDIVSDSYGLKIK